MSRVTRNRAFLTELLQAVVWSLVSASAALGITALLATTFLHDTQ